MLASALVVRDLAAHACPPGASGGREARRPSCLRRSALAAHGNNAQPCTLAKLPVAPYPWAGYSG
eukprot:1222871-Heterocapsa_arctica.AAC.1